MPSRYKSIERMMGLLVKGVKLQVALPTAVSRRVTGREGADQQ